MPTPTLTAGGRPRSPQTHARTPAAILDRWHSILTGMLELAVKYGELDDLVLKRRRWLAANPFHDLHDERHTAMWHTTIERNVLAGTIMDRCADLSRLQGEMPPGMVDGLAALLGHPLWPFAGQRWAMAAARMQSTDLFDIAMRVYVETNDDQERAEGEDAA